jgi:hypothetical protein
MKKIFFLSLIYPFLIHSNCQDGMKILIVLDQEKLEIEIERAHKAEVCTWFTNQLNANVNIQYFMDDTLVYQQNILMPQITIHDLPKDNGEIHSMSTKEVSRRILNLPLKKDQVNRYRAIDIYSKKILGQGPLP